MQYHTQNENFYNTLFNILDDNKFFEENNFLEKLQPLLDTLPSTTQLELHKRMKNKYNKFEEFKVEGRTPTCCTLESIDAESEYITEDIAERLAINYYEYLRGLIYNNKAVSPLLKYKMFCTDTELFIYFAHKDFQKLFSNEEAEINKLEWIIEASNPYNNNDLFRIFVDNQSNKMRQALYYNPNLPRKYKEKLDNDETLQAYLKENKEICLTEELYKEYKEREKDTLIQVIQDTKDLTKDEKDKLLTLLQNQ